MSLPVEVIEAVRDGRCVLVLGSRASAEAARLGAGEYPSAAALARKLGWERPRRLMGSKTRPEMPSVEQGAAAFEAKHGRTSLVRELRGLLGADGVTPSRAHRVAVARFPVVLSTAWDDLVERAAAATGRPLVVARRGQALPAQEGEGCVLYKVRGGFDEPSSLVVTARDHTDRPMGSEIRRDMRRLVRDGVVLFVGFRPDEEEFDRLWEDLTDAYGGELPRCHLAVAQGPMSDFLWQKWVWRGLSLFTSDPVECLAEIEERASA
ncbi:MAG: SIR2 family protein [Pseudomonadota bacterium]